MRCHDIRQVGVAYIAFDRDHSSTGYPTLADLRSYLPTGFPLDRYELLPYRTNRFSEAFVRELQPDTDGRREVLFSDFHVQLLP